MKNFLSNVLLAAILIGGMVIYLNAVDSRYSYRHFYHLMWKCVDAANADIDHLKTCHEVALVGTEILVVFRPHGVSVE